MRRPAGDFPGRDLHPVLRRIFAARKVNSSASINYGLGNLTPPDALPGISTAVEILEAALAADARILFIGDFDADGATSSALGVMGLRLLGARHVSYLVPNRFDYGYGLSAEIVEVAATCQPDLLITVDNGIASHDGVARAAEYGMSVIITDHHLPGERLPDADAIVNPLLPGSQFQSRALAGVGVIFYVIAALRTHLRKSGWFDARGIPEPNLSCLLDLVAVGTVADLVPLDYNNRILVANGLRRINAGQTRPGIKALLRAGGRNPAAAVAGDLGYVVGPRLNAAGRLQDISLGIECLLTDDETEAMKMAARLDELNRQRQSIEGDMREQALAIVADLRLEGDLPFALCLYREDWHQGLVGLIAGRIRETTNRPTIAFARTGEDELKGSARSTDNIHIRDALCEVATRNPGLIQRYGGHARAAGLSIRERDYDRFAAVFEAHVKSSLGEQEDWVTLYTDGLLEEQDLCLAFAELLRSSGPWGQGFPEPLFDDQFIVSEKRTVGADHLKMRLRKRSDSIDIDAIAFNQSDTHDGLFEHDRVRCVYRLDVNEYQGMRNPQLVVEYMQPIPKHEDSRPE